MLFAAHQNNLSLVTIKHHSSNQHSISLNFLYKNCRLGWLIIKVLELIKHQIRKALSTCSCSLCVHGDSVTRSSSSYPFKYELAMQLLDHSLGVSKILLSGTVIIVKKQQYLRIQYTYFQRYEIYFETPTKTRKQFSIH